MRNDIKNKDRELLLIVINLAERFNNISVQIPDKKFTRKFCGYFLSFLMSDLLLFYVILRTCPKHYWSKM